MTEIELFDRLNPKRDLPQATCDVISQVYKVMQKENLKLEGQIEKMKCCCNCKNWYSNDTTNEADYPCSCCDCDNKCSLWELKEDSGVINDRED